MKKQNCDENSKAKPGDILTVRYDAFLEDGTRFNTTEGHEPLLLSLGDGAVLPRWEEALLGICAEEEVVMVVTEEDQRLFYRMFVNSIKRIPRPAPTTNHYGIIQANAQMLHTKETKKGNVYDVIYQCTGKWTTLSVSLYRIVYEC